LPLSDGARVHGWTWFSPHHDGEKLAVVSDEGRLGLFGIRQPRNLDPALFPWLPGTSGGYDLGPLLFPGGAPGAGPVARSRAQVVQAQDRDFWVLARGRLRRVQLVWSQADGRKPMLAPGWDRVHDLGSPLHDSQVEEDGSTGQSLLIVVTQHLTRPVCLATAVEDDRGVVRWQRQLGLVCRGEPLALRPAGEGEPPLYVALDQGGGLYALDPTRVPTGGLAPWFSDDPALASALDDNPQAPPVLIAGPDGRSAYEIASPGAGGLLVVRHLEASATRRQVRLVREREIPLPKGVSLAGTPAVVGESLVLPLDNGTLARLPLPLPDNPALVEGPNWRSDRAGPDAVCHVAALGGDRFLTTDGVRGVTCWQWRANADSATSLPEGKGTPTLELAERLTAAPLVLPGAGGKPARVCLADAAGGVTLLEVAGGGRLQRIRSWNVKGKVTAGPYVVPTAGGVRVVCVVDHYRVAWLDPDKEAAPKEYATEDKTPVVGRPQPAEGVLVLADQAGRYVAVDPETAERRGDGYTLRASVAPAAGPVPFGPGRVCAPLSDGTVMLLTLEQIRGR
jgi:hypothetical protein